MWRGLLVAGWTKVRREAVLTPGWLVLRLESGNVLREFIFRALVCVLCRAFEANCELIGVA